MADEVTQEAGMKSVAYAAIALALASFGDAFLYAFLPVNSLAVGVPVAWVGIILSINRFIRIFSNTLLVGLFARFGLRWMMIAAVVTAILSTFGYAFSHAIVSWILLRVLWGLSFSVLRTGALGYALQQPRVGFALVLSRGLQELGPMIALLLAPVFITKLEPRIVFLTLTSLSMPALYFAFTLPRSDHRPVADRQFIRWPTGLNSITLVSAILIDGIIVIVLGVLFLRFGHAINAITATSLAAIYLGYRRVCLVVLSPGGGWLADKIGLDRIFNISMLLVLAGLVMIVTGWIAMGAIVVFTFYSVNASITPGAISRNAGNSLTSVAENATWRDVGASLGTLLGGFLISSPHLLTILGTAVVGLAVLLLFHFDSEKRFTKLLYLWK